MVAMLFCVASYNNAAELLWSIVIHCVSRLFSRFQASCNTDCGCSTVAMFAPVCGSDQMTYFSPCMAGCQVALDAGLNVCM